MLKRLCFLWSAILVGAFTAYVYSQPFPQKSKSDIVGKWDSRIRSNDYGIILEFYADGSFKQRSLLEKEGHYTTKDNKLTTYFWDDNGKQEKKRTFDLTLEIDQLTMKDTIGSAEIHLNRTCGIGSQAGITGEWFSTNYPGVIRALPLEEPLRFPVFVEFTKDRRVLFRSTPIKTTEGQYEFSSGVLILKFPGEAPLRSKPHISSEQTDLKLTKNGPEIPFRRVLGSECGTQGNTR